jgi:hypothetical protein
LAFKSMFFIEALMRDSHWDALVSRARKKAASIKAALFFTGLKSGSAIKPNGSLLDRGVDTP